MHLSPAMLEAAYCYLLTTPPCNRWKLPPADDVEFCITNSPTRSGTYRPDGERDIISISAKIVGRSYILMMVMAHEINHLRCYRLGLGLTHGREFKRRAALICREHGFDERLF